MGRGSKKSLEKDQEEEKGGSERTELGGESKVGRPLKRRRRNDKRKKNMKGGKEGGRERAREKRRDGGGRRV